MSTLDFSQLRFLLISNPAIHESQINILNEFCTNKSLLAHAQRFLFVLRYKQIDCTTQLDNIDKLCWLHDKLHTLGYHVSIHQQCPKVQAKLNFDSNYGLHLADQDYHPSEFIIDKPKFIGKSCHLASATQSDKLSYAVDYCMLGPIFPPSYQQLKHTPNIGFEVAKTIIPTLTAPCFLVGGLSPLHLQDATNIGATGIAMMSACWNAQGFNQIINYSS